jgi:hypothetical protein
MLHYGGLKSAMHDIYSNPNVAFLPIHRQQIIYFYGFSPMGFVLASTPDF